jgi:hypothetical protein
MVKVPVGNIPISEAFQRYYERQHADALSLQHKFEEVWASGRLEARVHDGSRELTITPGQWKDTCSPARSFFGGPIEDFHDGPLAAYRGLYPYTDELAFQRWLDGLSPPTAVADTECKKWLVEQMQSGPRLRKKQHYLREAQQRFRVSQRGFQRAWKAASAEAGNAWSKPGRSRKS